ncbi:MAG: 3,4-dihydroxy-2-butanone-4-phosphate synthase [Ktedonobacteraceae bacterium]|nr:3,4-dihydroxy-2-butanone-4-phosphate synthase [Ktedonobacteraceae bacterium]
MLNKQTHLAGHVLTVPQAIRAVQAGDMILICDDEERENEADVCLAAQFTTPAHINFLLHEVCGLICVPLAAERLDALDIPLAEQANYPLQGTPFTASVDARQGTTTGISASDRAATIRRLVDPTASSDDFARPGHVFPLRAHPRGTLARRGHTEAAVDLMRLAGLEPGAVVCEALDEHGEAARGQTLVELARKWGMGIVTVEAIARFRREHGVCFVTETRLPTTGAPFRLRLYRDTLTAHDYLALVLGDLQQPHDIASLVRLHSACTTGDIFGSRRCDCQAQMQQALQAIVAEGRGVLLYLPQEGRGIGLAGKLQAYVLQEQGYDTLEANERLGYPADARSYERAVEILRDLGICSARLLTNNARKLQALRNGGLSVERVPLEILPTAENERYLQVKYREFDPEEFIAS